MIFSNYSLLLLAGILLGLVALVGISRAPQADTRRIAREQRDRNKQAFKADYGISPLAYFALYMVMYTVVILPFALAYRLLKLADFTLPIHRHHDRHSRLGSWAQMPFERR